LAELFERPHKDVLASIRSLETGDAYRREQPAFAIEDYR
jgi:hypothetical protein